MAGNSLSTLNSKLRVLIAKTFRAEKLYSSMLNVGENSQVASGGVIGNASLNKMANDVRAKEWQASHEQLRTSLNELVRLGHSSTILDHLEVLYEQYYASFVESGAVLDRGVVALIDTARRQEFAHVLKLSVEMTRHKARLQASKVIADELYALIAESGRGRSGHDTRTANSFPFDDDRSSRESYGIEVLSEDRIQKNSHSRRPLDPDALGGKIIPLRRRSTSDSNCGQN